MAAEPFESTGDDAARIARISSQPHELSYAASKLPKGKRGSAASKVRVAKKKAGRTVSRTKVMAAAKGK